MYFEKLAAAVDHAGVMDALRFETTANGPSDIPEFGSVKTEEGFHALRVAFDTGHFGAAREQAEALTADEWAFLLWQFGEAALQPGR